MPSLKNIATFVLPLTTLCNTIIGVGFFALPYIAAKVGFLVMLAYFAILGTIIITVHLFFAELALKTPDHKRLPGFAKIYLGKWGEWTGLAATVIGMICALLIFMAVGGQFLHNLLSPYFGGTQTVYSLIYLTCGSFLIYLGITAISRVEFWEILLFFGVLVYIYARGASIIDPGNLATLPASASTVFLPYGAVLFSLWGASSIPEVEEMLGARKDLLKKVIVAAGLIAMAVYTSFVFFILGITGSDTTESALIGLKPFFGPDFLSVVFFFGFITSFTSFIIIGLTLRKIIAYDLGISRNVASAITFLAPLGLFLLGLQNFISVISFAGGFLLGIDGILILLMYQKIRPDRKMLTYPLIAVFFFGMIYEIVYAFLA